MENEPNKNNQPPYAVDFEGARIHMERLNTRIFVHDKTPGFDHVYLDLPEDSEGTARGTYFWREDEDLPWDFDTMITDLNQLMCSRIVQEKVSEFDIKEFAKKFGIKRAKELLKGNSLKPEKPKEEPAMQPTPELPWTSPRIDRQISGAVGFLIYLAENDKL